MADADEVLSKVKDLAEAVHVLAQAVESLASAAGDSQAGQLAVKAKREAWYIV